MFASSRTAFASSNICQYSSSINMPSYSNTDNTDNTEINDNDISDNTEFENIKKELTKLLQK